MQEPPYRNVVSHHIREGLYAKPPYRNVVSHHTGEGLYARVTI